MRAEDLRPKEILSWEAEGGFPTMAGARMVLTGMATMSRLRSDVLASLDPAVAFKIYFRFGYEAGLGVAWMLDQLYDWDDEREWFRGCARMRRLAGLGREEIDRLVLDRAAGRLVFEGTWYDSFEALTWLAERGVSPDPVCHTLAGMASGYASAIWGDEVLVRELSCQAQGHDRCRFEGRPVAEWGLSGDEVRALPTLEPARQEIRRLRRALDEARSQAARRQAELDRLRRDGTARPAGDGIVYRSAALGRLLELARKVAPASTTVLISGETGTGKEVLARFIHRHSRRESEPFVAINCAALPPNLLESELFGHVRGAFTGADRDKRGLLVEAGGGTIFLDEVGEMPLELQAKLLRVLQDREARPVGGLKSQPVRARVVAATNRDLREMVAAGRFREDLYFRLAVIPMEVPPLRQRREDILPLARNFLAGFAPDSPGFSPAAVRRLEAYAWPGNVRELENAMEYAAVLSGGGEVTPEHLPLSLEDGAGDPLAGLAGNLPSEAELVARYTDQVLAHTGGNKAQAARIMGIGTNTLWRRLKAREPEGP